MPVALNGLGFPQLANYCYLCPYVHPSGQTWSTNHVDLNPYIPKSPFLNCIVEPKFLGFLQILSVYGGPTSPLM